MILSKFVLSLPKYRWNLVIKNILCTAKTNQKYIMYRPKRFADLVESYVDIGLNIWLRKFKKVFS